MVGPHPSPPLLPGPYTLTRILLLLLLWCGSCATISRLPAAPDSQFDSALTAAGIPPLRAGKVKFNGDVYVQIGQGHSIADHRKAGQRQGSAATAPGAVASTTSENAATPLWVFGLIAGLGLAAGFWLRGRLGRGPIKPPSLSLARD